MIDCIKKLIYLHQNNIIVERQGSFWMKLKIRGIKNISLLCVVLFKQTCIYPASVTIPFNGCTFYKPRLAFESFANATDFGGCANFSAILGRNGCKKTKGPCPACVVYPGDNVQIWLPDYFIEVTKHVGRSVFAESIDGKALAQHLKLASSWWSSHTFGGSNPLLSNGTSSDSARESFWHARILTVPYGSLVSNYPPLGASKGVGLPFCYSAISEYLPDQWNYNLSDGPYAVAWASVGGPLCLTSLGAAASGAIAEAKSKIGGIGRFPGVPMTSFQCATPVGAQEGLAKNTLPSSDTMSPITSGDITKLCMGSWGNLVPRTGWIASEDPHMSAMLAAYKFMSIAGDFNLNSELKLRNDDKWQIVYPPRIGGRCFIPGSPLKDFPPAADDPLSRTVDELDPTSSLKNQTYIIAVWRKRESCEEPLQYVQGWSASYKANYYKNLGICQAMWSK